MSPSPFVMLSIPGLRRSDLPNMPQLRAVLGDAPALAQCLGSFPCVTWPAQATVLTGTLPNQHGVIANGFFWRDRAQVEMWTASNQVIQRPQIWDLLKQRHPECRTLAWFPMLSKESGADIVCMPAPIHNPDGSESLWCYTKPRELYGELLNEFGHFPLQHFWGPLAGIQSSQWIARSLVFAANKFRPDFMYVYLPHLDYAGQKFGPFSPQAQQSVSDLDTVIGELAARLHACYGGSSLKWLVVSEYVISPVEHVTFPNRVLREAGLLSVRDDAEGECIDFAASAAWALVDHQFSHVFVRDHRPDVIENVGRLFGRCEGIREVVGPEYLGQWGMDHERSGDVMLISRPGSWQAYYWWMDDARAPAFARTVDIHRKPGYDPVELFFDPTTRSIPLDASLVRGSHGLPEVRGSGEAIVAGAGFSHPWPQCVLDTEICERVLREFDKRID
ncbi:MAG TPA: alkaline phosphatase family protein [Pirellulaceae bacterium]|nr:alkaline phosphatase family protein [Pirellulaceae bacterium]